MNVLEVKNLSIGFSIGKNKVAPTVSEISFHLRRGEILALVGESGCGKSISCMSLSKLLPSPPAVVSGTISLRKRDGSTVDVMELSGKELRKIRGGEIAYIFQEPSVSLNPVFRIGDQIREVLELHRPEIEDTDEEIISLLKKVGIPAPEARIKCYPHELSGGMQQRVMIAMALASNPSILIADEPTTALDVTIQAQILDLIKDLQKQLGMSVMLITHDLGVVAEMCDEVIVMYAGQVCERGTADEIFYNPKHEYTKGLIRSIPTASDDDRRLEPIGGTPVDLLNMPDGCPFAPRCDNAMKVCLTHKAKELLINDCHAASCWYNFKDAIAEGRLTEKEVEEMYKDE